MPEPLAPAPTPPGWQAAPWPPHPALAVQHTPLRDFVERLRRRQPFAFVRLDADFAAPRGPEAEALAAELDAALAALPRSDPDGFVAVDAEARAATPAQLRALGERVARALPRGATPEDGGLFRRATLDGSIRALYAALRPYHVVAVGPVRLAELGERLPLASFHAEVVAACEAVARRHELLARLATRHAAYRGEPVAYLLHAGLPAAGWALALRDRLRNATWIDAGAALDACLPGRVLGRGCGLRHWRAVARHLGVAPGPGAPGAAGWISVPPPGAAPARRRDDRARAGAASGIERRAPRPGPADAPALVERVHEGDVERRLREILAPRP